MTVQVSIHLSVCVYIKYEIFQVKYLAKTMHLHLINHFGFEFDVVLNFDHCQSIAKTHFSKLLSLFQNSSHSEHNSSLCGLNCGSFSIGLAQNTFIDM